jgi:glycosyltransferase involved in cell wall biosynthesis
VEEKGLQVLPEVANQYEVVSVDDGSPDRSGAIADELAREYPCVRVVHHEQNRGYGEAIKSGFSHVRYEWVCMTDGDDEYDIRDLRQLIRLKDYYDLIITFRYVKSYSGLRMFISWVYNKLIRALFWTPYRDISTGLRLVRRSLIDELHLESTSPFMGAEIAIKTMLKGFRVGEVGIQTFPRTFGRGESVTVPNIIKTMQDLVYTYRTIFSKDYR